MKTIKNKKDRGWNYNMISISQMNREGNKYQKRKHMIITGLCNNNCRFCFSKENLKIGHLSVNKIKKILDQGLSEGCEGLIISGGEPTIHPEFIEVIYLAKKRGYKYIEVITNGRMFSYPSFFKKVKDAGLDAITFSVHGHNAVLHDFITRVKGSYNQVIKAVKFASRLHIPIKINVVVNKKNINHLKDIASTFSELGVRVIGLLQLVPFGEAWNNRDRLFYDLSKYNKSIKEFLEESKKRGLSVWSNRFNVNTYSCYPELAQDPDKFVNEVEARLYEFQESSNKNKPLYCYPNRCDFCFLKNFCKTFFEINDFVHNNKRGFKVNPIKFADYYARNIVPLLIKGKKGDTNLIKHNIPKFIEAKQK